MTKNDGRDLEKLDNSYVAGGSIYTQEKSGPIEERENAISEWVRFAKLKKIKEYQFHETDSGSLR